MRSCDVKELQACLEADQTTVLIDVREYAEYAAGRIPGARLISLGEIERRAGEINRSFPVYVVCRTGRRAAEAQRKLIARGFNDVRNVTGGFMSWQAAGFPVERDERAPWSLERQVRFTAGLLVLIGALLAWFAHPGFVWLPALVGAGLVFAAATDSCAMGMMLAKMPWNRALDEKARAACHSPNTR
jgi:rhodanese-related sulfurtransferase